MSIDAIKSDDLIHAEHSRVLADTSSCVRLPRVQGKVQINCSGLFASFEDGAPVTTGLHLRRGHLLVKRALDIVLSAGAIVGLSPVLATVALLIKLEDGGPVLFRQKRVGKDGKLFEVFKFRSMRVEACDALGAKMTREGDDRITRIGRWIRKSSFDELPQLFNIFKGDMAVVGPRPHVPAQQSDGRNIGEVVPYYDHRHRVLPGLTGWAQASGYRGPTDDPAMAIARVNHDLAYIEHFSIWLDIKTILNTVKPKSIFAKAF